MLFKTTAELQEYAEILNVNLATVKPTIRLVEEQHLVPAISKELYTALNTTYNSEVELTEKHKTLLDKCRTLIAPYLVYYYTPKAEVKLSEAGAQRTESPTNKTAYQNQVANFREQNLREGELATESLLEFIELNKADYPDYVESDMQKELNAYFIKSAKEFNQLFPSHSPYRNFMAMRGKMYDVEQNSIPMLIGSSLFLHLKTGVLTDPQQELLQKVKKVVAYQTVATALPFLHARIDTNGITVYSTARTQDDNKASRNALEQSAIERLINSCYDGAKSWSNNILYFLRENEETFIDFITTTETTQPIVNIRYTQPALKGSFGLI